MKMNKNTAMIIAGVVVFFLVYWFFFRKKTTKTESGYMTWLGLPSEPMESGYRTPLGTINPIGCPSGFVPCRSGCCPIESGYASQIVPARSVVTSKGPNNQVIYSPASCGSGCTPHSGPTPADAYCICPPSGGAVVVHN